VLSIVDCNPIVSLCTSDRLLLIASWSRAACQDRWTTACVPPCRHRNALSCTLAPPCLSATRTRADPAHARTMQPRTSAATHTHTPARTSRLPTVPQPRAHCCNVRGRPPALPVVESSTEQAAVAGYPRALRPAERTGCAAMAAYPPLARGRRRARQAAACIARRQLKRAHADRVQVNEAVVQPESRRTVTGANRRHRATEQALDPGLIVPLRPWQVQFGAPGDGAAGPVCAEALCLS
jgi:hypothetical protein